MRSVFLLSLAVSAFLILTGCMASDEFGEEQVRGILISTPKSLDGEQVMLTFDQLSCGDREELWSMEAQGDVNSIGRLTEKGRALGFTDDIRVGDQRFPYTQIRGQYMLQVLHVDSIRDEGAKVKIVDAKIGVPINHSCFVNPVTLMGVRKGQYTQDAPPRFQLALNGGWEYDRLLH